MRTASKPVISPTEASWIDPIRRVGNLTIVGERHKDKRSENVLKRTIEENNGFDCVVLEYYPTGTLYGIGGMEEATRFARRNDDVEVFCIDEDKSILCEALPKEASMDRFREVANEFSKDLDGEGRVHQEAIRTARERVYQEYGLETYNVTYELRERRMARRLAWLDENYLSSGAEALVVVGAFHLPYIEEALRVEEAPDMSEEEFRAEFESVEKCKPEFLV